MPQAIKKILKQIPFFYQIDFARRRAYESKPLDFRVKKLAKKLETFPRGLIIDTTNRCNAKCVWCPHPASKPVPLEMDDHLFKKIIKDFSSTVGTIKFGNYGEPLLDKDFLGKIQYLRNFKNIIFVDMNTNISLLNKNISKELIKNNINLELSLDELDKNLYKSVKGLDFDKVITNLMDLLHLNNTSKNNIRIIVKIKTLQGYKEIHSNPLLKKIRNLLPSEFIEILPISEVDPINKMAGNFNKENFESLYIPEKKVRNNYRNFNLINPSPCAALWKYMVIVPNGNVVQCCVDVNQEVVLGNLANQSITEIWQGDIATNLRKTAINRERKKLPLCKNCDLHQGWQYLNHYFTLKNKDLFRDYYIR